MNDATTLPRTIAFRRPPARRRRSMQVPMTPPANVSPAPVGSKTSSSG
jgi:hypothetical protein